MAALFLEKFWLSMDRDKTSTTPNN
jgi:hypothetical protein